MTALSPAEKSTNGRVSDPAAPWLIRAGFAALGSVAPPMAAAWAESLFLTPPRHPAPAREAEALAAAHHGTVRVGDHTLATWTWGHGPTVVLVHGWGGRGGQLHAFVPGLLARGFSVVAFDGPGHGRSSGRTASLVEQGRALTGVVAALPSEVVGVVAHSMGGAATAFALSRGLKLDRAVFVGAPASAGKLIRTFAGGLELPSHVTARMRSRIERRLQVPFDDLEMVRMGPGQRTALLVIHDEDDKEVPFADGVTIGQVWPGARLHRTQGLGHRRILSDGGVVDEAVSFLAA